MNIKDMPLADLNFELTLERTKTDPERKLKIENEILRRRQKALEQKVKDAEPSIKKYLKSFFKLICLLLFIGFVFVLYSSGKSAISSKYLPQAEGLARNAVLGMHIGEIGEVKKLFRSDITGVNVPELEKFLLDYQNKFVGEPRIVKFENYSFKGVVGFGTPDYVYEFNVIVETDNASIALRIKIVRDGDHMYLHDYFVLKSQEITNPLSA